MVRATFVRRLKVAEGFAGVRDRALPPLFVTVEDAGLPDPDAPAQEPFAGDSDVIGATGQFLGRHVRVTRLPGESIAQLEARAQRLEPAIPLFFFAYASMPCSREAFDRLPETDGAKS